MDEDKARKLIEERQRDDKLACAQAFKIAEESGIPRARVGEILNEMNIKLHSCQLGCF
jgi:hypothetical protein